LTLPVPGEPEEARHQRALIRTDALEESRRGEVDREEMSQEPLSTMQAALVALAHRLNKEPYAEARARASQVQTEHEAAVDVYEGMARFLER